MTELFLNNIYLSLLLPLWIFLIIMLGRFFSVYVNRFIIYLLTLFSSAFGAILCAGALWKLPPDSILDSELPFIKINDLIINCGLYVDKTALIFGLVLFLVSFFVQIFSFSYMKKEKKTYRFYALINLFNFSMAGLFFSSNLFQTYLFWEIIGLASYLLIGFEYNNSEKSLASRKVFIINRIGDTTLIAGTIFCSYLMYSYAPNKLFATLSFIDMNSVSTLVYAYASQPFFEIICGLFIISSLIKSAQFPFYNWLQDAMCAKLPVSALLHSATLVAAGIFLTIRLLPFYTLETNLLKLIAVLGLITAILCSLSACAQINPKKVLAYSTSAQFGLIYFAIGMLNLKAAFAFFIAHAFIKSLLFILLPNENEKWNYIKFIAFLISGLSLSGILFSGMIAKEMIALNLGNISTIILSIISFLTAFYIIRIALLLFDKYSIEKTKLNLLEWVAIIGLLILNIAFYFYLHKNAEYKIAETFWSALTAWVCVYILYIKNAFWKVPILYPLTLNGFYIDNLYNYFCEKIYTGFANLCNTIDTKVFANYNIPIYIAKTCVKISSFIEAHIMNKAISITTNTFKMISSNDIKAQDGSIQRYNTYAFIIITAILTSIILGYMLMIIYIGG